MLTPPETFFVFVSIGCSEQVTYETETPLVDVYTIPYKKVENIKIDLSKDTDYVKEIANNIINTIRNEINRTCKHPI